MLAVETGCSREGSGLTLSWLAFLDNYSTTLCPSFDPSNRWAEQDDL